MTGAGMRAMTAHTLTSIDFYRTTLPSSADVNVKPYQSCLYF